MSAEVRPFIVGPGDGAAIRGPVGGALTFKARGAETGGALTLFENVIPPGEGPPLHTHAHEDEAWYVLEGRLRFRLGEATSEARPGAFVFVPRGTAHAFRNDDDAPARILVLFTPAGMERFFERHAALAGGPVDPAVFGEIAGEAGMEVLGPPLAG